MKSPRRTSSRSPEPPSRSTIAVARLAAISLILVIVGLSVAAYDATLGPQFLTLKLGICEDSPCVSWVMPGGHAWSQGARPGMTVVGADGRSFALAGPPPSPYSVAREAELVDESGKPLHIEAEEDPIGQAPLKFSLWAVGGIFVALGAAVLVRRPELPVARMFAAFTGFAAAGLAVGPSSGAQGPVWSLVAQAVSVIGIGAFCLPFAFSLLANIQESRSRAISYGFPLLSVPLISAYAVSVVSDPSFYEIVRPTLFLYVSASLLGAAGLLAIKGLRLRAAPGRQQAMIALSGLGFGTLPFVVLTLIPESAGLDSLVPVHLSVLFL